MYYQHPRRPWADGRKASGRRTRQRLLTAATREFAAHGFDSVTTRDIARAARAKQASIRYHFGGKGQLYLTVAALVADKHGRVLLPLIAKSRREFSNRAGARDSLAAIVEAFIRQLLDNSDGGAAGMFVVRELSKPGAALTILHDRYIRELHEHVTVLLARSTARLPRASDAIIDAHALLGAAVGFVSARTTFRVRSYRPTYTQDRVDAVATRIAKLSRCISAQVVPSELRSLLSSPARHGGGAAPTPAA